MNSELVINHIVNWIKDYTLNNNKKSLVIGISGGIDSALTSILCAKTKIKTFVVSMPINHSEKELERANKHINWLKKTYSNVEDIHIDLSNLFKVFSINLPESLKSDLGLANSKARLRMTTLYQIGTSTDGLIIGTGNKIEDFCIGFFTKYGDGGVDISPIGDLTKSEVYCLAKHLNIIDDILKAEPTDGLWQDGRTDVDQIGASYEEIEWAINNLNREQGSLSETEKSVIKLYKNINKQNKHKMNPIPVCFIPKKN